MDAKAASLAFAGVDGHVPSMSVRDASHDGEAQTRAASVVVRLTVRVEDVRQSSRGNADTVILDHNLEFRGRVDDLHDDATPARGKADRVGAEVGHELVEPFSIAHVSELRSVALALEGDTRLGGLGMKLFDDAIYERCEIERLPIELYEPRAEAGHLEDFFDEPEKALGALADDVCQTLLTVRERTGSAPMK